MARTGTSDDTTALLNRLRRIEGQIRGIQRMVEEDRECDDLVTQIMAVRSGVEQVGRILLDRHLERCLLTGSDVDAARLDEVKKVLRLGMRFAAAGEGSPSG